MRYTCNTINMLFNPLNPILIQRKCLVLPTPTLIYPCKFNFLWFISHELLSELFAIDALLVVSNQKPLNDQPRILTNECETINAAHMLIEMLIKFLNVIELLSHDTSYINIYIEDYIIALSVLQYYRWSANLEMKLNESKFIIDGFRRHLIHFTGGLPSLLGWRSAPIVRTD